MTQMGRVPILSAVDFDIMTDQLGIVEIGTYLCWQQLPYVIPTLQVGNAITWG